MNLGAAGTRIRELFLLHRPLPRLRTQNNVEALHVVRAMDLLLSNFRSVEEEYFSSLLYYSIPQSVTPFPYGVINYEVTTQNAHLDFNSCFGFRL